MYPDKEFSWIYYDRIRNLVKIRLLVKSIMTLNLEAKKILLRKIPHGLFICGVRDED